MDTKKPKLTAYLSAPLSIAIGFILAILVFHFILKNDGPVPIFIMFAVIEVTCMIFFAILPDKGKTIVRMISMFMIGLFLLVLAGLMGKNNFQLESFWFYIFAGSMAGVIVHFIMAKIIGPIFFSRNWCSWGCWSSMIFDLLPYKNNIKWQSSALSKMRYVHFFLSMILVTVLFFVFKYTIIQTDPKELANGMGTGRELVWLLVGNFLYYLSGIILAFKFKDNRAFCKYICPLTVFLKFTNKITLLRIKATDNKSCTNCRTCANSCPMGIDIPSYVKDNTRVLSTECIMCMKCVQKCPEAILKTSLGFDYVKKEYLNK
jgi:ferredoxin-type protein NapH